MGCVVFENRCRQFFGMGVVVATHTKNVTARQRNRRLQFHILQTQALACWQLQNVTAKPNDGQCTGPGLLGCQLQRRDGLTVSRDNADLSLFMELVGCNAQKNSWWWLKRAGFFWLETA